MANIVYMARSAWTGLLDTIRSKAGITGSMTVSQAADAVDSIETGGDDGYKQLVERTISVASGSASVIGPNAFNNCTSLISASFPLAKTIKNTAFGSCSKLTTIKMPAVETIELYAFQNCSSLTEASFPETVNVSQYAFARCTSMSIAYFPKLTSIQSSTFASCSYLTSISFPLAKNVQSYAFGYCTRLSVASFPNISAISAYAFASCSNLLSLYLLGSSIVKLNSSNAFINTPISNYTTSTGGVYGSIFVPASLYDQYISASNWSLYSSRIVSVAE